MNPNASRSTARVVRLADLDDLPRPPPVAPQPPISEFADAQSAHVVADGSSNDSVAPHTDWATGASGEADRARAMHPIGSTLPGTLSGPEVGEPLPWTGDALGFSESLLVEPDAHFPPRDVPRLPAGQVIKSGVRFDANGADYARIWWVNVALLLLTLGLAWPWAYQRRERYFLRHTRVASHRLDFRLPASALWPRYASMLALWAGVGGAMSGSLWAGLVGLSLGCAVWPLMAYLKINQCVASLTWAGRRMWFDGTWQGLTRAMQVPMVLAVGIVWTGGLAWHEHSLPLAMGCAGLALVGLLCLPQAVWTHFRYRQDHLRLGPLRLEWKGSRDEVAGVILRAMALTALVGVLAAGAACVVFAAWLGWHRGTGRGLPPALLLTMGAAALLLTAMVVRAYVQARLINLVWNKTGNRHLRFRSRLSVAAHVRLAMRNALLTLLTLGLYHPWAAVAMRGLRVRSLRVSSRVDPETLLAYWSRRQGEAPPTVLPSVAASRADTGEQSTQPSVAPRRAPLA